MNTSEKLKRNRKIILLMLILAIASIPVSVLIAYFVGDGLTFSIGGLCSAIWICAIFMVFPIASLIYGIVMAKKGYPAKRDIVVGAICLELMLDIVILFPLFSEVKYDGNFANELTYKMYNRFLDETTYKGTSFNYYSGVGGDLVFYKEEDRETFNKMTLNAKWNDHISSRASQYMSKAALQRMKGFDCYYYSQENGGGINCYVVSSYLHVSQTTPYTVHKLYAYNKKTGHLRYYAQATYH